MPRNMATALSLALLIAAGASAAQEAESPPVPAPEAAPRPESRPKPRPKRAPKPEAPPAAKAATPEPAPQPPALPLAAYVEAATVTIIAEQSCPGIRLNAGQLTNVRLAARVAPAQEGPLEEQLRARSVEIRRSLAADGREAWCATALDAYGPTGTVARGVLAPSR